MTYLNKLNSFDEVAEKYAKTAPVLSKNHTPEDDVRPIGKRTRKWERIIKVSEYCYALSAGGFFDPVFSWGYAEYAKAQPVRPKDIALLAPIVWRKHKDGTETITVRNGTGDWQHNAWYSFLARALPRELWFRQTREGRQFIYNRRQGQTLYLPKTRSVPRHVMAYHRASAKNGKSWSKRYLEAYQNGDDGLSLTFQRTDAGGFNLVGEPHKELIPRLRVNTDEKRAFKGSIAALRTWAETMYPMLRDQLNYSFFMEINKDVKRIVAEKKIDGCPATHSNVVLYSAESRAIRSILKDPEHPLQYHLGVAAIQCMHDAQQKWCGGEADAHRHARACFNRWINKMAGFATVVKEEK